MNQLYAEAGVKRKDDITLTSLRVLLIVGIVVGVLLMLLGGAFGIAGVVIVVILIYMFPKLNIEYEYIFVDGQLDFDKIIGKAKRKTLLRIDMEQVEIVAPEASHALDGYTYVQYEKKDFTSRSKASKPYIIIASAKEKKYRISFEPSEEMITMMKQKSPRKITQY